MVSPDNPFLIINLKDGSVLYSTHSYDEAVRHLQTLKMKNVAILTLLDAVFYIKENKKEINFSYWLRRNGIVKDETIGSLDGDEEEDPCEYCDVSEVICSNCSLPEEEGYEVCEDCNPCDYCDRN